MYFLPTVLLTGEIVEGSKDLDFSAATEESNSEIFGGGISSSSSFGDVVVGSKRALSSASVLVKDEELGGRI